MDSLLRPFISQQGDRQRRAATELSDEEKEELAEQEKQAVAKLSAESTPLWLIEVDEMAGGDRQRWEYFFELGVVEFLNAWSWHRAKRVRISRSLEAAAKKGGFNTFAAEALRLILFTKI